MTLIATLAGAIFGAAAAFLNQAAQWQRQQKVRWDAARLEVFANFLGKASSYYVGLRNLAWALRREPSQVRDRRVEVDRRRPELLAAKGEVQIVIGGRAAAAAAKLLDHLETLNSSLYAADAHPEEIAALERGDVYDERCGQVRDAFTLEARKVLNTG